MQCGHGPVNQHDARLKPALLAPLIGTTCANRTRAFRERDAVKPSAAREVKQGRIWRLLYQVRTARTSVRRGMTTSASRQLSSVVSIVGEDNLPLF